MQMNSFKSLMEMKKVMKVSTVALMGAMMISANSGAMAMMGRICESEAAEDAGARIVIPYHIRRLGLDHWNIMNNELHLVCPYHAEDFQIICEWLKTNTVFEKLYLSRGRMSKEMVKPLGEFLRENSRITDLSVWHSEMDEAGCIAFADAIKSSHISHLMLCGNKIDVRGANAIVRALRENVSLRVWFDGNEIVDMRAMQVDIPANILAMLRNECSFQMLRDEGKLCLEVDKLNSERLVVVCDWLKTNPKVLELHLSGYYGDYKKLSDSMAVMLADALKDNSTVTYIDLSNNAIANDGGIAIADLLKQNSSLTCLKLDRNSLGDEAGQEIGEALKVNSSLTSLSLDSNDYIGDETAKKLAMALKVNSSLAELNLASCKIRSIGAQHLGEGLEVNTALTSLNLYGYYYGNRIGDEGARAMAVALKKNSSLTSLNLHNNGIGAGFQEFAEALGLNSSVMVLDLSSNILCEDGAIELGEALKENNSLTSLELWETGLNPNKVKALSEGLKVNSALTELKLGSNASCGDEGVKYLSEALRSNSTLTSVSLSCNGVSSEGAKDLSEMLRDNSSLAQLSLAHNSIDTEGAQSMGESLKINSVLTSLDLEGNSLGDEGVKALADGLMTNSTLTQLHLPGKNVTEEGKQALADTLETNVTLTDVVTY